jgi:hypothetical protein
MKQHLQQVKKQLGEKGIILTLCTLMVVSTMGHDTKAAENGTLNPPINGTQPMLVSVDWITAGARLEHWKWPFEQGEAKLQVIEVDLQHPYIRVDAMGGRNGQLGDRQTTTQHASERGAVAAINGDFFTLTAEGAPFGTHIQSGVMMASPGYISPKNTFSLDFNNIPAIGRLDFDAFVTAQNGSTFRLFGVNKTQYQAGFRFEGNSHQNRLHLYTDQWNLNNWVGNGLNTPYTTIVVSGGLVTDKLQDKPIDKIPQGGFVLLGQDEAATFLNEQVHVGETLTYSLDLHTDRELWTAIDGSSLLIREGQPINHTTPGRNARTAIGYSQDERWLYLVTAERSTGSTGLSIAELAQFMVMRGAHQAVNLDGGGSTSMSARPLGYFQASPVLQHAHGSERQVPNALGIFSTAPKGALLDWTIHVPKRVLMNEQGSISLRAYDEYYNPLAADEVPVEWLIPEGMIWQENRRFQLHKPGVYELVSIINGTRQSFMVQPYELRDIQRISLNQETIRLQVGHQIRLQTTLHFTDGTTRNAPAQMVNYQLVGVNGEVFPDGTLRVKGASVGFVMASYEGFSTAIPVIARTTPVQIIDTFQQRGRYAISGLLSGDQGQLEAATLGIPASFSYTFGRAETLRIVYLRYGAMGMRLSGLPAVLTLDVRGDKSGHWLRAELRDGKGVVHRLDLVDAIDWEGWRTVSIRAPLLEGPVTLNSLYVVRMGGVADETPLNGEIGLANLRVENWQEANTNPNRPALTFTLNDTSVERGQELLQLDQAPVIINGRTMLPVRHMSELLGGLVEWKPQERKVQVTNAYQVFQFWLDHPFMSRNGTRYDLDQSPVLLNGRTMLPLRALSEAYGLYVHYDSKTQQILVY